VLVVSHGARASFFPSRATSLAARGVTHDVRVRGWGLVSRLFSLFFEESERLSPLLKISSPELSCPQHESVRKKVECRCRLAIPFDTAAAMDGGANQQR
jgi:hypothetical protein